MAASDALGNNALHWSVITRQIEWIKRFASAGTPIDSLRADGHSPVLLAASGATDYWYRETRGRSHPTLRNASVLVGYLLSLGAEYTASLAAAVGDQERLEQLNVIDRDSAKRLDSSRVSPLSRAAASGYTTSSNGFSNTVPTQIFRKRVHRKAELFGRLAVRTISMLRSCCSIVVQIQMQASILVSVV